MSRTYRRKKDSVPEWVTREWEWSDRGFTHFQIKGKLAKREVAKWRSDCGYHGDWGDSPGWWVHLFMEVPHRARTRNALKKILRLDNYEDAYVCPAFKRPQEYYW